MPQTVDLIRDGMNTTYLLTYYLLAGFTEPYLLLDICDKLW